MLALPPVAAEERPHAWPRDAKAIEAALGRLGLPVGAIDGIWDRDTARATCVWRELTGREVLRSWPLVDERRALKATTTFTVPTYMRVGVNINRQCQAGIWVTTGLVESATTVESTTVTELVRQRTVVRVMPASTGQSGVLETHSGSFRVQWAVNRWWQSTIYADGLMYRPFFFNGGQALHGSSSDALVKWYPASHGCVRMLHADIDALWDAGFGRGDRVYVYGEWLG